MFNDAMEAVHLCCIEHVTAIVCTVLLHMHTTVLHIVEDGGMLWEIPLQFNLKTDGSG